MKVQVLVCPGCGHGERALRVAREVVQALAPGEAIEVVTVATLEDAARWAFPGSPTIRVEGVDVDPAAPGDVGLG